MQNQLLDDLPLESNLLTKSLDAAQKRVEERDYDGRKYLFDYDDIFDVKQLCPDHSLWFRYTNHPNAYNIESLEVNLNFSTQAHFSTHKDKLFSFAQCYPDLHDWDGSTFPFMAQ